VRIEVELSDNPDDETPRWRYVLGFKPEGKGAQRTLISTEQVWEGQVNRLNRPDSSDNKDVDRLTQTHLEQIQANGKFRELADFFGSTTYLHLVPQLLKYGDRIGGQRLEDDPFGQGFLERVAKTVAKTRDSRLKKIEKALSLAVPQFKELRYRPNAGWQREEHFSDGTLRLLGLLWVLLDGDSLLLLEEPELSLNDAIVKEIPRIIDKVQRSSKRRRQVLISTHSEAMLSNPGIDGRGILLLEPAQEGSRIRPINEQEAAALAAGFSVAEVVLPKTRPAAVSGLGSW
jgi:predicted ATPase